LSLIFFPFQSVSCALLWVFVQLIGIVIEIVVGILSFDVGNNSAEKYFKAVTEWEGGKIGGVSFLTV
jgi:hypothetical protein